MASQLQFYGKVVVVTGAGGGLGRQYALQFARRGAALVVNDLGGSRDGEGGGCKAADVVVDEIQSAGGKAVADYNSVEEGEKIVQTALDKYGKIDIIVNNAGIVRDRSFVKMSKTDWDLVHNVHLRGSFMVTKAAWPHLRKQNFGRVIFTSSAVAMFGNFGQANYSAAKMGLVGLCKTLAIEGSKYNIGCNTIIPTAVSRLTEELLPADIQEALHPKYVSPLVLWLSHDSCNENGGIFEAGAGWIGKYEILRSQGVNCLVNNDLTPENISDNWSQVTDMSEAEVLEGLQAQISSIISSVTSKSDILSHSFRYTPQDIILYALSVGCSVGENDYLKFLYENHENFVAIPTFGVLPSMKIFDDIDKLSTLIASHMPNLQFDLSQVLHGEQYMEVQKPIDASGGKLTSHLELVDILDKKSGVAIILNVKTYDDKDEVIYFNQVNLFITEGGGFGGKRSSDKVYPTVRRPDRKADVEMIQKTTENQAALYRLTGDKNPLHIDPEFSALGGFTKPILHGLCTLGIASRHVMSKYGDDDPTKFKCIKARFCGPVTPGETVRTKMWKESSRIHFEVEIVESNKTVINGAYIDFISEPANVLLKSSVIFEEMGKKINLSTSIASEVMAVYRWNITKNNEVAASWKIDLKDKPGVYTDQSPQGNADCTLTCDDDVVVSIMKGELDPTEAYMKGQLKIDGNVMLSQKLGKLLKSNSKL